MGRSNSYKRTPDLASVVGQLVKKPLPPETGWYLVGATDAYIGPADDGQYIGVGFTNSWANDVSDDDNPPASWYSSEDGEARYRGLIVDGSVGDVAFNVPEGFRPRYRESFKCDVEGGGHASVKVYPNGDVIVESVTA